MTRMSDYADGAFVVFIVVAITVCALVLADAVAGYRAWPYEQACHHAHLVPDRRPFSAPVACLPPTEIPR